MTQFLNIHDVGTFNATELQSPSSESLIIQHGEHRKCMTQAEGKQI